MLLRWLFCFGLLAGGLVAGAWAQDQRVFLISLDGLGYRALTQDPAAQDMRFLQKVVKEGIAAPMQTAFPSLTAAAHASIFTGVYGNENGVTANSVSPRPRAEHRFDERVNGFRAEQLDRENFWLAWARKGLRVTSSNSTQGYPCRAVNSGENVALLNGYQTMQVAPEMLLRAKDVEWLRERPEGFPPLRSRKLARYFAYLAGKNRVTGALWAKGRNYDSVTLAAAGKFITADLRKVEDEPLRAEGKTRELARYFAGPLELAPQAGVYVRLFAVSPKGDDFLLYQTPAKEISLCWNGAEQDSSAKARLFAAAGAFVGNGAGGIYSRGGFGPPLQDGVAESRLLETLELHTRQTMAHTRWMLEHYQPRLAVDYLSTPDDMLHLWWGLAEKSEPFLDRYRAWGYQMIDWRVARLAELGRPQDHLVVVSDHGMTAMTHELRLNQLLSDWGYRERVFASYYGLFVNTKDWQGGLVEAAEKRGLLEELRSRLEKYEFEGKKIFRAFYWPEEAAASYGAGGDRGADLYFDLADGWSHSSRMGAPVAQKLPEPRGEHGPLPTREDLLAVFLHLGPGQEARPAKLRTVDVASYIQKLLAIH